MFPGTSDHTTSEQLGSQFPQTVKTPTPLDISLNLARIHADVLRLLADACDVAKWQREAR